MDGTILRPELAALGATDGQLLSGRAVDNDDPLSRRDQGLEFLDVAERVRAERIDGNPSQRAREDVYRLTNISDSVVDPHLLVIVRGLPSQVRLENAGGTTKDGDPYLRVFLEDGILEPGERITRRLVFTGSAARRRLPAYDITLLSGQGMPWRSSPALEMTTPRSPPRPGVFALVAARLAPASWRGAQPLARQAREGVQLTLDVNAPGLRLPQRAMIRA